MALKTTHKISQPVSSWAGQQVEVKPGPRGCCRSRNKARKRETPERSFEFLHSEEGLRLFRGFRPKTPAMILRAGLCPGLAAEMVERLKAQGVRTVVDLVSSDMEEIAQKCSLSYKTLVAVRRVLLAQFSSFPANGADLYEELKRTTAILSTGIKSLDKLLDSGLYTGEITELVGAPGSGKTQACLSISANTALSLKQDVLYIDSMGGFTATRLLQLLQCQTENEEEQVEALRRIQVVRVFEAYRMLDVLQDFRTSLAQQVMSGSGTAKVLVVDSVSAVIYPLLGSQQPDGMALMTHLALELKTLAKDFGMAVVLTNHVTRDAKSSLLKPALGRTWSFVPSTRVLLEAGKESPGKGKTCWMASLLKCPRQPVGIQVELELGTVEQTEGSPVTSGEAL